MAKKHLIIDELQKQLAAERKDRMEALRLRVKKTDLMCLDCLEKYGKLCEGELPQNCKASVDINLREELEILDQQEEWDQRDKDLYAINMDPVKWAKLMFGWEARWYQQDILYCLAQKRLIRMGRRSGKCLHGDARIHLLDGGSEAVKSLVGQTVDVLSFDGSRKVSRRAKVSQSSRKPGVKVRLASGRQVIVSHDHPFMGFNEWIEARDLRLGDRVATERSGTFGSDPTPDEVVELLAFAIGDGGVTGRSFKFTNWNPVIIQRARELAEHFGASLHEDKHSPHNYWFSLKKSPGPKPGSITKPLRDHGVWGKSAREKTVPAVIWRAPRATVALFLNRLFSNDGWASVAQTGRAQIGYASASYRLARDVQELLFKFGIPGSLCYKPSWYEPDGDIFDAWQVTVVQGDALRQFADEIGILGKESAVDRVREAAPQKAAGKSWTDTIPPGVWEIVKDRIGDRSVRSVFGDVRVRTWAPSRAKVRLMADLLNDDQELRQIADADVIWDKVVALEDIGEIDTYDLSVLDAPSYDDRNFSVEGIYVHNTEVLAVSALHHAFTTEEGKVLIICPYQDQVDIVFQVLRRFINASPPLQGSVEGDKQNPQRITFKNKAFLFGITAGTRTGMKGDKARGQDATAIYLDEADYLDKETLEALLAIFASRADCKLWASSTPTGQRSFFYDWSLKPRVYEFKEFHHASNVSPQWTPAIEMFYREMFSTTEYEHEFEAEFGDAEAGVYKNEHVDASLRDYSYTDWNRRTEPGFRYALGVDWNDAKHGVHMLGIEYNPDTLKLTTCLHDSVDAPEFTQTKAVEHIIELHRKWNFDTIYVDQGYGDVQVEQLHLFGQKHPASKLGQIVRGIRMQENLVIRDPFTGQDQKKNAKHLMVQMSARRLESMQCVMPKSEDKRTGLVWQMRNFRAEKISRDGIPTYSTVDDHALVAWQLAILALILEFTDLVRAQYSHRVEFADVYNQHPQTSPLAELRDDKPQSFFKKPEDRTHQLKPSIDSLPAIVHVGDFQRPKRPLSKRVSF